LSPTVFEVNRLGAWLSSIRIWDWPSVFIVGFETASGGASGLSTSFMIPMIVSFVLLGAHGFGASVGLGGFPTGRGADFLVVLADHPFLSLVSLGHASFGFPWVVPHFGLGAHFPSRSVRTVYLTASSSSLIGGSILTQSLLPSGKGLSHSNVHLDLFSLTARMIRFRRLVDPRNI
jgi:hypothetical protein